MRTFIALELGEALRERVRATLEPIRKFAPHARWVRADRLHLTLAFLGETADATSPRVSHALEGIASHHSAFSLALRGSGVFGAVNRPRVLWLAVAGDMEALTRLQTEVERVLASLGHPAEHPTFEPHITLCRSRNPHGDPELARCADALRRAEPGSFEADAVTFFSSLPGREGMDHLVLSQHSLARSGT